ncbi:unnamed protein product [Durusdinium trenchii]|uniref:Uncharacterized protein n=1 Tax=Durusdinium trenchii TaxID=1381693 RepID=A0ABP0KUQ1_9DINO
MFGSMASFGNRHDTAAGSLLGSDELRWILELQGVVMADVRRFESVVLKPLLVLWIQRFCSRTPRSLWHKARRSFLPIVNKISWMMRGRAGVAQMRCGLFRCGLYLSLVASVRTSHAMLLIVNSWSACLLQGDASCLESKNDWRCISGLFRKTSRKRRGDLGLDLVGSCGARCAVDARINHHSMQLFAFSSHPMQSGE